MGRGHILPSELEEKCSKTFNELLDLVIDSKLIDLKFHIIIAFNYLLPLEAYIQAGALKFKCLDTIESIIVRVIDLFVENQYGNNKQISETQLDLIDRILSPYKYNLGSVDIEKALKVLSKPTPPKIAQPVRIRRMM